MTALDGGRWVGGLVRPQDGKQLPTVRTVRVVMWGGGGVLQALNLRHLGVRNDWADGCRMSLEGGLARPPITWGEEEEGLAPARP